MGSSRLQDADGRGYLCLISDRVGLYYYGTTRVYGAAGHAAGAANSASLLEHAKQIRKPENRRRGRGLRFDTSLQGRLGHASQSILADSDAYVRGRGRPRRRWSAAELSSAAQPSIEPGVGVNDAKPTSSQGSISGWKVARELVATALVSLLAFFAIHSSVENFRVSGYSMQPTLVDGQHLIANKLIYSRFSFHPPYHGDIAIMVHPKDPSRDIVKRVIGLPGDIIKIERGQVIRNGERLGEPYITHRDSRTFAPLEVPPDSYYVLGDNRRASTDSRAWGFVPRERIIGRAWLSYWPSDRLEFLYPLW